MAVQAQADQLGWAAPDFTLPGVDGRDHELAGLRGPKGLVLVFMCNHCPYVRAVIDRIERDSRDLLAAGIGFAGINANDAVGYPEDSFDNMQRFAAEHGVTFPYLHDASQAVAKRYGALCTPDFFGFDAALKLRYRGRLDASRSAPVAGARRELYEAMLQVASGGEAPSQQHPSIGCSIKWKAGNAP